MLEEGPDRTETNIDTLKKTNCQLVFSVSMFVYLKKVQIGPKHCIE